MNYLMILMMFLFSVQQPEIKLLEINAEWNKRNDVKLSTLPKEYNGIPIKKDYALLENQAPSLKASINAVPVIILIIDGKLKSQWTAGSDPNPRDVWGEERIRLCTHSSYKDVCGWVVGDTCAIACART